VIKLRTKTGYAKTGRRTADLPAVDVWRACGARRRQMATLPLEANVQFMTVMATKMPYIRRG
jgi:hypothetical protein